MNNLGEKTKIFVCDKEYPSLIKAMEKRGWHRNRTPGSLIFNFLFVLKSLDVKNMLNSLKDSQIVNHYSKSGNITTKVGLQRNLQNAIWQANLPQEKFFPRCFDLTACRESDEFLCDFKITRAEAILKKYMQNKECTSIEKLLIAIEVNSRRVIDIDEQLDVASQPMIADREWEAIEKDKFKNESSRKMVLNSDWYQRIQEKYLHLCQGELLDVAPTKLITEIPEEEQEESDEGTGSEGSGGSEDEEDGNHEEEGG